MPIRRFLLLTALCALAIQGCSKNEASSAPGPEHADEAAPHAADMHAPAAVEPGSHEDWCGEHQVPESLCTRCNPSLVAAFKATGDWCAEHGLPESQCLICNPDLKIERPPKKAGAK